MPERPESLRRARPMLGTFTDIRIIDAGNACPQSAIEAAFVAMKSIDEALSFHRPDSELSRLNAVPGSWQLMGRHGLRLLKLAQILGRLSDDSFNVTVGGELVAAGALPRHVNHTFIPMGNWQDIELKPGHARLRRPVLITLDGIAKGYAVDLAIASLKRHGVQAASVNAGGDLRVFGETAIRIVLRNDNGLALGNDQGMAQVLWLKNAAIASSRYGGKEDARFASRIITGNAMPESAQLHSVIAPFAWRADALTKIAACGNEAKLLRLGGRRADQSILKVLS